MKTRRKPQRTPWTQRIGPVLAQYRYLCVLSFVSFVSLVVAPQAAQQPQTAAPPVPPFRSGTRLIVQTVSVKDKDGKPIEGLTAKDFTVTEDGEPQTIRFVEFQRLEEILKTAPPVVHTPANVKV